MHKFCCVQDGWRIAFWIVNMTASVFFLSLEIKEIIISRGNFQKWKESRSYVIAAEKQLYKENFRPVQNLEFVTVIFYITVFVKLLADNNYNIL